MIKDGLDQARYALILMNVLRMLIIVMFLMVYVPIQPDHLLVPVLAGSSVMDSTARRVTNLYHKICLIETYLRMT